MSYFWGSLALDDRWGGQKLSKKYMKSFMYDPLDFGTNIFPPWLGESCCPPTPLFYFTIKFTVSALVAIRESYQSIKDWPEDFQHTKTMRLNNKSWIYFEFKAHLWCELYLILRLKKIVLLISMTMLFARPGE